MDLARVETEFGRLKADFESGALIETEFKAKVEELMIEDEQGRWWVIGYKTGLWYVNDGEKWVQQEPPRPATVSPPSQRQQQVTTAPAPESPPKPAAAVSPTPGVEPKLGRVWLPVLLAGAGWLFCFGFPGLFAWNEASSIYVFEEPAVLFLLLGIGAGIAGLITALALRLTGMHISWSQVAVITVGCLLSAGLLGGLVTALALKWKQPFIRGKNVAIVTLGWAIVWGIGFVIAALLSTSGTAEAAMLGCALWGALVGAVGTWVTLWQIGRARATSS